MVFRAWELNCSLQSYIFLRYQLRQNTEKKQRALTYCRLLILKRGAYWDSENNLCVISSGKEGPHFIVKFKMSLK